MRNPAPSGEEALNALFGRGEDAWVGGTPFIHKSVLPVIPKGFAFHL